jgi:hypothetical protein
MEDGRYRRIVHPPSFTHPYMGIGTKYAIIFAVPLQYTETMKSST